MPDQSRKLLVFSRNHRIGPAIWLALLAGLRSGEIQALRFRDVDLDRKLILIRSAYKAKVRKIEPYPKQGDWGSVPISSELAAYLSEMRRNRLPEDFVVQSRTGGMLPYRALFFELRQLCEAAELPRITPHELRHSCSELLCEAGASEEHIRRVLNHKSLTAVKTYIHRSSVQLVELMERVRVRDFKVVSETGSCG